MLYVVYADVFFLHQFILNLVLFGMMQIILRQPGRFLSVIIRAGVMAVFTTGIYVVTTDSRILYYILYAMGYFFMTYFFAWKSGNIWKTSFVATAVCIWLAGLIQLFCGYSCSFIHNIRFYAACIISFAGCLVIRVYFDMASHYKNRYEVELLFSENRIRTYAFLDTGNCLKNPYTGAPAIVIDYHLLKKCLSENGYKKLILYHKTGTFPYVQMNEQEKIYFFPIPYHTIGNNFSLMPALYVQKLSYCAEKKDFYHITAGISRQSFMNEKMKVLLHEKLKP